VSFATRHRGQRDLSQRFHGGAIPVLSPYANRQFASQAPNIAGLPGFTDDQIIALLPKAGHGSHPPRPPMPPFRMSRQDAQAIVAISARVWIGPAPRDAGVAGPVSGAND
jgi:hypothetical protein